MTPPSSPPTAKRSLVANVLVGGLVALAAGVPLLSSWAHDREEQRLGALLNDGRYATATVDEWSRNKFGNTEHCHYVFRANGIEYSSSVNIPGCGGTCCRHVRFLPIIYDPADGDNHIVGQTLTQVEVDRRLSIYPKIAYAGWLCAALALLAELFVRGQLGLVRGGVFTIGTVTRLDYAENGGPLLATYEFLTPAGERCERSIRAMALVGVHVGQRWPSLVFDPDKPSSAMLTEEMWAVDFEENPRPAASQHSYDPVLRTS